MKTQRLLGLLAVALGALLLAPGVAGAEDGAPHSSQYTQGQQSIQELGQLEGADFEIGYINRTIPHHQGAIRMASIIAEKAPTPEVRQAAETIIAAQTSEIAQLEMYLQREYGQQPNPDEQFMLSPSVIQLLEDSSPAEAERLFLLAIREHHQSLNIMSGQVLQKDTSPELIQIATGIIATQRQEQVEFAMDLERLYGVEAPLPTGDIVRVLSDATGTDITASGAAPLPTTGGAPLPDTGGPDISGPQSGATLAGLALLAIGVGGYALLRRRKTFG